MTALDYARIADVYDAYVRYDGDVAFFAEVAAEHGDGRVLELMAGTGRVTLPLLERRVDVTVVDVVPAMLAVLRAKALSRGLAPALCCADVRSLPFDGGFALVLVPFQGFSELLTEDDQRRALASIHRALEPGGRCVLTLHNPRVRLRSVTGEWVEAVRAARPETGGEVVVRLKTAFDAETRLVRGLQRIEEHDAAGVLTRTTELPLTFSLTGRSDFRRLIRDAGLGVSGLAGDFEGRPYHDADSPLMVWTLVRERGTLGGGWRSSPEPEERSPPTRSSKGAESEEEWAYDVGPPDDSLEEQPVSASHTDLPEPPATTDVHLAVSTRRAIAPDSELTVRFAAYTERFRSRVMEILRQEAPRDEPRLDLETCQWAVGTEVTVSLTARGLDVETGPQQFNWNGKHEVLRFDVVVPAERKPGTVVLRLDVLIAGLVVARLRPEVEVVAGAASGEEARNEVRVPRTAFASYASEDRESVMSRIRSLEITAKVRVFLDCLSIRPGERWKNKIRDEICEREIFWLFWSRHAQASKWVDWEWRTALDEKTLDGIQPHPLEPADVAPAPPELEDLQFGGLYERLLLSLRER